MRRCLKGVLWLGISAALGLAGCSGESAPPLAAIKSPGDERSEPSDALSGRAQVVADEAPSVDCGSSPTAVPETADAAVRAVITGLQEGHPDVLWDALPASHQRDLNDLVRLSAKRLNPEAWRWFLQIAGKGATVVRPPKKEFEAEALSAEKDQEIAGRYVRSCEALAELLERISKSRPDFLQKMQSADLGEMLRTDGRRLVPILSAPIELIGTWLPKTLRDVLRASVSLKDSTGDSAVLELAYPDSKSITVEFVCIEGKWIPRWLADRWTATIGDANQAVQKILPSETANENFGWTFQALAAIDSNVDQLLWSAAHPGIDPGSTADEFPFSIFQALVLLGYYMGGPPTVDPDFLVRTEINTRGEKYEGPRLLLCPQGTQVG